MKNPSYAPEPPSLSAIRQMTEPEIDGEISGRLKILLGLALTSVVIGGTIDLLMDQPETWLSFHVVFESLMICGALLMATTLWLGWMHAEQSLQTAKARLENKEAERDAWKSNAEKALQGLALAIDSQFDRWGL